MSAETTAIHAFVRAHRDEEARFLAEIVKVPSDNPPGDCDPSAETVAEASSKGSASTSSGTRFRRRSSGPTAWSRRPT